MASLWVEDGDGTCLWLVMEVLDGGEVMAIEAEERFPACRNFW